MYARIRRKINKILGCTSGNATLIVALGAPVLIGGAGLGVDLAQWYMWKRELQFAVDQAAVAGAWARTDSETDDNYVARARLEYNANISVTDDFNSNASVQLANYAGGTANSVVVSATASRNLPFSSFITGRQATISAFAQASFTAGQTFTSCIIAVDEDDDGAITIGGNAVLTASCGLAALSNSPEAVIANGNPTVDAGWILARGGIDDWFDENTDDIILENVEGLFDPFEDLDPPNPAESQVARTYTCASTAASTTANIAISTVVRYTYFRGANANNAVAYTYASAKPTTTTPSSLTGQAVVPTMVNGYVSTATPTVTTTQIAGNGSNKIYERKTTTVTSTYSNVVTVPGTIAGNTSPGTYSAIHVSCDTAFAPGVYIIDGGGIDIIAQYEVTGNGVMFVLKNGAYIKIRGGSDINLTAIQAADLIARGVSSEQANLLAGMLVFEDRESEGTSRNDINGNSNTVLNGTLYFPVSNIMFSGTATVTSQCLMIAADTITLQGKANMTTFCPAGSIEDTTVATVGATVRLVA